MRWLVLLLLAWGGSLAADDPPSNSPPAGDTPRIAAARAFVEQLAAGEFEAAATTFDETMRQAIPADKLGEVWKSIGQQFGPFQKCERTRVERTGAYVAVIATLVCEKGEVDARVVYDAKMKIAGLFFTPSGKYKPPAYADESKFTEVDVQVGEGMFPLPGTLSLPAGAGDPNAGRVPCVVLVHGSGPNDRDETIGPNKPFRDLAHGLATRGVAVLRYEKRTRQHPLMMTLFRTSLTVKQETVDDAVAAAALVAKHDRIDPKRVFIAGHSLGGYLIPRIAAATDVPAGYISLAGSARPMEDLILEQQRYLISLDGRVGPEEEALMTKMEKQVALAKSDELKAETPSSELPLGVPARYWLDLRDYRPADEAKPIARPLLFLQGERDYQVTLADFTLWKTALGERSDVRFKLYPKLNHLFMPGPKDASGKSTPAEYATPSNVAEEVVGDIAKWVLTVLD